MTRLDQSTTAGADSARQRPLSPTILVRNPLSSAQVRFERRMKPTAPGPGPDATRPFGLREAQTVPTPVRPRTAYCPERQLAVGDDGQPLVETMKKEWKTKSSTDGDEGPEENWGWKEE